MKCIYAVIYYKAQGSYTLSFKIWRIPLENLPLEMLLVRFTSCVCSLAGSVWIQFIDIAVSSWLAKVETLTKKVHISYWACEQLFCMAHKFILFGLVVSYPMKKKSFLKMLHIIHVVVAKKNNVKRVFCHLILR